MGSKRPLLFSSGPRERIFLPTYLPSYLLMAILRIFRPALACLLLLLALSQEAPQEALWGTPQDAPGEAPREAKKGVKCKDPKGSEGDYYYEGCYKFTCVKASKRAGIWVETPALDIC